MLGKSCISWLVSGRREEMREQISHMASQTWAGATVAAVAEEQLFWSSGCPRPLLDLAVFFSALTDGINGVDNQRESRLQGDKGTLLLPEPTAPAAVSSWRV